MLGRVGRRILRIIKNRSRIMEYSSKMEEYKSVCEGKATVLFDKEEESERKDKSKADNLADETRMGSVFYNPVQEFNRDMTVLFLATYSKKEEKQLSILEALSASGLRCIRYKKEIDNVEKILANDLDPRAAQLIKLNIEHNGVTQGVVVHNMDANYLMNTLTKDNLIYNVIDLDPYGTALPFLDAAISSISTGGLLCVTFTDAAVLAGNQRSSCFYKYGVYRDKSKACQEMALRICLYSMNSIANRQKKYIVPLLSLKADFYYRLFVKVMRGGKKCKETINKTSLIFQCSQCPGFVESSFGRQSSGGLPGSHCGICGGEYSIQGPFWSAPLHDYEYIMALEEELSANYMYLKTNKRISATLEAIKQEQIVESNILSYNISELGSILRCPIPRKQEILAGFHSLEYKIAQTAFAPDQFKTNAPAEVIFDVMKEWKIHQSKDIIKDLDKLKEGSVGKKIMERKENSFPNNKLKFDYIKQPKSSRIPKYLPNPQPYWGPKSRAIGKKEGKGKGGLGKRDKAMGEEYKLISQNKEIKKSKQGEEIEEDIEANNNNIQLIL